MINIALCTDIYYMMACGPCVISIFEHHKNTPCHIYVVYKELLENDKNALKEIARRYGQELTLVPIDSAVFMNLKVNDRFRESIYYRLLLPNLLPDLDKIIYLDCDIVLNGSLEEFWNVDIDGYACGVVEDQESDDIILHNRIGVYDTYFNSGVILFNMDYWRKNNVLEDVVNYIYDNPEKCIYPDQDAMNAILHGKVKFCPYGYNFQDLWHTTEYRWIRLHNSKFKEVDRWKDRPVVVHFAGDNKPWFADTCHPFKQYYLDCLAKTPWKLPKVRSKRNDRHKYIRRFNRMLILAIVEAVVFVLYIILS